MQNGVMYDAVRHSLWQSPCTTVCKQDGRSTAVCLGMSIGKGHVLGRSLQGTGAEHPTGGTALDGGSDEAQGEAFEQIRWAGDRQL